MTTDQIEKGSKLQKRLTKLTEFEELITKLRTVPETVSNASHLCGTAITELLTPDQRNTLLAMLSEMLGRNRENVARAFDDL